MTTSNDEPISPRLRKRIDIVVPLYNEQDVVRQLHRRLVDAAIQLPFDYRIIYVDDGSSDRTIESLLKSVKNGETVELVRLSRNFGQSAAILSGLEIADGDAVVVMDGDLQDPPELIVEMANHWMMGFDVVIARRQVRDDGSVIRRAFIKAFHRVFQWLSDHPIPADCGTFCLLDANAAQSIRNMPESHRFFPGLRSWVGFEQGFVDFPRPKRAAGSPKQTYRRLFRYAADGIFSFSRKPARLMMGFGLFQIVVGIISVASILSVHAFSKNGITLDWPLALSLTVFVAGIQLVAVGIVAELAFRIYEQVKGRPSYVVQNRVTLGARRETGKPTENKAQDDFESKRRAG